MKKFKNAFTLAELLITLGIIGVVAAITIPNMITNYQKKATVNRLKHAYSTLYQAIRLSENENGDTLGWDYETVSVGTVEDETVVNWLKKYITPYVKTLSCEGNSITLLNGTQIKFSRLDAAQHYMHVTIFLEPANPQNGRNSFIFYLGKPDLPGRANHELRPYEYPISNDVIPTREDWINEGSDFGCNANAKYKSLCAGLIMHDNWTISKDYPW